MKMKTKKDDHNVSRLKIIGKIAIKNAVDLYYEGHLEKSLYDQLVRGIRMARQQLTKGADATVDENKMSRKVDRKVGRKVEHKVERKIERKDERTKTTMPKPKKDAPKKFSLNKIKSKRVRE